MTNAFTSDKQPEQAVSVLADDHSEIDTLIGDLLSALEEETMGVRSPSVHQ